MRNTLAPLGYGDAKIQKVDEPELGKNVFQISTSTLEPNEVHEVRNALDDKFGAPQSGLPRPTRSARRSAHRSPARR